MLIQSNIFSNRVVHGFTNAEYDLSPHGQDWSYFPSFFGSAYTYALVSQVHGNNCLRANHHGLIGEADALITDKKGLVLAIRTADCVPVLVEAEDEVIVIHAGWRGIANGIIEKTLSTVQGLSCAAIGPCISSAAYEVGQEVIEGIVGSGVPKDIFVHDYQPKPHVDLKAAARYQLQKSGVTDIDVLPHCTFLDENFHSYRRDGNRSGRLAGFIGFSI